MVPDVRSGYGSGDASILEREIRELLCAELLCAQPPGTSMTARPRCAGLAACAAAVLSVVALTPPPVAAQETRVLYVPAGSVPSRLRRTVERLLATRAVLVSYDTYVRAAAEQDLYPSNLRAIRRVATQQGADVIVVVGYGGHHRRRVLTVRYYSGSTGELITRGSHGLRGQNLRGASQHAILRDLESSAGGVAPGSPPPEGEPEPSEPAPVDGGEGGADSGDGGLPPPLDWDAAEAAAAGDGEAQPEPESTEEPEPSGSPAEADHQQFGFSIGLGFGIMQRQSDLPAMAGTAVFRTNPFPAIQAEILGYVRPEPTENLRVSLSIRYTTSVGLVTEEDLGQDPMTGEDLVRTTDMRAHHLKIGVRTDIPLAPGDRPTVLLLEAGWAFRMLDSEIRVAIPDYTLHGLYARVGLFFHVGDTPLSIGIVPEIGHLMNLSEQLSQLSMVGDGFHVGAEAHVRLEVIPEVSVGLMYRESHAVIGTGFMDNMNDVERYGVIRGDYRF